MARSPPAPRWAPGRLGSGQLRSGAAGSALLPPEFLLLNFVPGGRRERAPGAGRARPRPRCRRRAERRERAGPRRAQRRHRRAGRGQRRGQRPVSTADSGRSAPRTAAGVSGAAPGPCRGEHGAPPRGQRWPGQAPAGCGTADPRCAGDSPQQPHTPPAPSAPQIHPLCHLHPLAALMAAGRVWAPKSRRQCPLPSKRSSPFLQQKSPCHTSLTPCLGLLPSAPQPQVHSVLSPSCSTAPSPWLLPKSSSSPKRKTQTGPLGQPHAAGLRSPGSSPLRIWSRVDRFHRAPHCLLGEVADHGQGQTVASLLVQWS